jgi:hypothetical protein
MLVFFNEATLRTQEIHRISCRRGTYGASPVQGILEALCWPSVLSFGCYKDTFMFTSLYIPLLKQPFHYKK